MPRFFLRFLLQVGLRFRHTLVPKFTLSEAVDEGMDTIIESCNGFRPGASFQNQCLVGRYISRCTAKDQVNLAIGVQESTVSNSKSWNYIVVRSTGNLLAFGSRTLFLLYFFSLVAATDAIDNGENSIVPLYPQPFSLPGQDAVSDTPGHAASQLGARFLTRYIFFIGVYLGGPVKALLGPFMGVTSVLWINMWNDSAVKPGWTWLMFGLWSVLILAYLTVQCHRVVLHKLYILLTLVFAGLFIYIVTDVQNSTIRSGLVTSIPPCTSFSAYVVAFFYPDRPSVPVSNFNMV